MKKPSYLRRGMILLLAAALLVPTAARAQDDDTQAIRRTLDAMAAAVRAGDADAYRAAVDESDPLFVREHDGWIVDWSERQPVDRFEWWADAIQIAGDTATADLTLIWTLPDDPRVRRASYPARFRRGTDGVWRYAGAAWITVEVNHFRVEAFPGQEGLAEGVAFLLPSIYRHVTGSLDYAPEGVTTVKLYTDPWALTATTRLSLPPIQGWNEPGESIKLRVEPDRLPDAYVLAHEYTHHVMFDMAGTTLGRYPWWLAEGVAEFIASRYWPPERTADRMAQVLTTLVDWDAISDFETAPEDLWAYVYPQGYAFVRYVTETFGAEARTIWLRGMAGDEDLAAATESAFGMSFAALDRGFRAWLMEQMR